MAPSEVSARKPSCTHRMTRCTRPESSTLTIRFHSVSSPFGGRISTTSAATRRFHPGAFTLTFGMHSISTGFGSRISTTNTTARPTAFSRLKRPGNLHGTTACWPIDAMWSTAGIDPHLSNSQHFESFRRPVIHIDRHNMTASRPRPGAASSRNSRQRSAQRADACSHPIASQNPHRKADARGRARYHTQNFRLLLRSIVHTFAVDASPKTSQNVHHVARACDRVRHSIFNSSCAWLSTT
ncbi:hypothetical protein BUUB107078_27220 [Burkholderia ubonensis]|nr:hypothetical protein BUB20358_02074 [Burkholderia ubonensis]